MNTCKKKKNCDCNFPHLNSRTHFPHLSSSDTCYLSNPHGNLHVWPYIGYLWLVLWSDRLFYQNWCDDNYFPSRFSPSFPLNYSLCMCFSFQANANLPVVPIDFPPFRLPSLHVLITSLQSTKLSTLNYFKLRREFYIPYSIHALRFKKTKWFSSG